MALEEAPEVSASSHADVIVVDDALKALALVDERKSRVVELRFFGGLSVEETAEVLKVSPDTVARDWRLAKAWLLREMGGKDRWILSDGKGSRAFSRRRWTPTKTAARAF